MRGWRIFVVASSRNKLVDFDDVIDGLKGLVTASRQEAEDMARTQVSLMFRTLLNLSPQYTGEFVANYKLGITRYFAKSPVIKYNDIRILLEQNRGASYADRGQVSWGGSDNLTRKDFRYTAKQRGSQAAINFALDNAQKVLDKYKLGDTIYIFNDKSFDGLDKEQRTSDYGGNTLEGYFRWLNKRDPSKQIRPVNLVYGEVVLFEHVFRVMG